jgi:hypothetical protein
VTGVADCFAKEGILVACVEWTVIESIDILYVLNSFVAIDIFVVR